MVFGAFKEKKEYWDNANLMSKDKNTRLDWRRVAEHLLIGDVISAIYCYGTNPSQNLVLQPSESPIFSYRFCGSRMLLSLDSSSLDVSCATVRYQPRLWSAEGHRTGDLLPKWFPYMAVTLLLA